MEDLITRLRSTVRRRRKLSETSRRPDHLADLLEEAATKIEDLECEVRCAYAAQLYT